MPETEPQGKAGKAAPRAKSKSATPAPKAVKKTTAKAKPAAAPKRRTAVVEPETEPARGVSVEERRRMVQEAAYYVAERAGFRGDPSWHWLVAEAEIDAQLLRERDRRG